MLIRKKAPRALGLNEPIRHGSHKRPVSRRDFISQGFLTGPAVLAAPSALLGLLMRPGSAQALSGDLDAMRALNQCNITGGAGKVPFICFDLAGGANLTGSEVLIGNQGGQMDFLTTAGYSKLGLPGDMVPNAPNAASPTNNFINAAFGLAFHSDGAILRGMLERTAPATQARTNGAAIAARSENDTSNNPHNPMYGIFKAGAKGELLTLIGSRSSDSGGNSIAPMSMIVPEARPTKVDRSSDVTGLVDTGELGTLFGTGPQASQDAIAVLEAMTRVSHSKSNLPSFTDALSAQQARRDALQMQYKCGYVKSAYLAETFSTPAALNPDLDTDIVGAGGIFTQAEYNADDEFRKTAAIMKMVVNGYAGAGTVTMGGYDYHGQGRNTGELRNFRAGRCIGACLEYAARKNKPLMIYVFSDGSLNANGQVDNTADGRGKFMWVSDNQSTASSFFLVFSPTARPVLLDGAGGVAAVRHQQIGYFRADGSVETASHPGANAVNLLVETVILNYMALHGEQNQFQTIFPQHGLGSATMRDGLTAFDRIV